MDHALQRYDLENLLFRFVAKEKCFHAMRKQLMICMYCLIKHAKPCCLKALLYCKKLFKQSLHELYSRKVFGLCTHHSKYGF